jgi:hypothetical protein
MTKTKLKNRLGEIVDGGQVLITKARAERKITNADMMKLRARMLGEINTTLGLLERLIIAQITLDVVAKGVAK